MTAAGPVFPLGACTVRPWAPADLEALARHANDAAVWRNLRDLFPHPYTREDAEAWIARSAERDPPREFAIEVDGEAAGGIGLMPREDVHRRTAEIGYWVARPWWGRGIATAAVRAVSGYAFQTFDLVRLEAFVFEWNPASRRVLEKAGYVLEGRLRRSVTKEGSTMDSFLYALVREG